MNVRRRRVMLLAIAAAGLTLVATPALGRSRATVPLADEPFIVVTGELVVPAGSTVSDAIILNGDATINGDVEGQVIALHGDVTVSGNVGENVMAFTGKVTLEDGANVGGDVVSRRRPLVAPTATVGGSLRPIRRMNVILGQVTVLSRILVWLATSVSSFVLGLLLILLLPKAMDATARTASSRLGQSIGFGVLLLIGLPLFAFVAIGVLVGIPLGVGVLLALGFVYWLGWTTGAYALGRRLVSAPRHRLIAFLAGWGILRGLALVPILSGLAWLAATVWGLGALAIAARAAGRSTPAQEPVAAGSLPPPIPPPPPMDKGPS